MGLATITMLAALYLLIEYEKDNSIKGWIMVGLSIVLCSFGIYRTILAVIELFRLASSF